MEKLRYSDFFHASLKHGSNPVNVFSRKLGMYVVLSSGRSLSSYFGMLLTSGLSSLFHLVRNVVSIRSKPKVHRIATVFGVTSRTVVENVKSFWNFSVCRKPRHPLRVDGFAIQPESSIAMGRSSFCPSVRPASVRSTRLVNSAPKPVLVRLFHNHKTRHPAKVLREQLSPQLLNDGRMVCDSVASFIRNREIMPSQDWKAT